MSRNAIIMLVCLSIFSVSAQDQSAYRQLIRTDRELSF